MSFNCEVCGEHQPEKTTPTKVVTQKRKTFYPEKRNRDNEVIARQAHGWEIVQEKDCCAKCAPKAEASCNEV